MSEFSNRLRKCPWCGAMLRSRDLKRVPGRIGFVRKCPECDQTVRMRFNTLNWLWCFVPGMVFLYPWRVSQSALPLLNDFGFASIILLVGGMLWADRSFVLVKYELPGARHGSDKAG